MLCEQHWLGPAPALQSARATAKVSDWRREGVGVGVGVSFGFFGWRFQLYAWRSVGYFGVGVRRLRRYSGVGVAVGVGEGVTVGSGGTVGTGCSVGSGVTDGSEELRSRYSLTFTILSLSLSAVATDAMHARVTRAITMATAIVSAFLCVIRPPGYRGRLMLRRAGYLITSTLSSGIYILPFK